MSGWLHFLVVTHWGPSALREWRERGIYVKTGVDLLPIDPPLGPL